MITSPDASYLELRPHHPLFCCAIHFVRDAKKGTQYAERLLKILVAHNQFDQLFSRDGQKPLDTPMRLLAGALAGICSVCECLFRARLPAFGQI